MARFIARFGFAAVTIAAMLFCGAAIGVGTQRSFVASYGLSTNTTLNCSLGNPCRQFSEALGVTDVGGEVIVLDSAGYGIATITQSVSIIAAPGVYGGISAFAGQDGITVDAPGARVVLRGLTINGQGGLNGVRVLAADALHIEDCTVANFAANGIRIEAATVVHIVRANIRSNGFRGLNVFSGGPTVEVSDSRFVQHAGQGVFIASGEFNGSRLTVEDNTVGIVAQTSSPVTINATLADSVLTRNGSGFVAKALGGGTVNAALTGVTSRRNNIDGIASFGGTATTVVANCEAVGNGGNGVSALGGATVIVSGATAAGNVGFDLFQDGSSVMRTTGNNALSGRGAADISGVLTPNALR
jgi:hypothetical protein